MAWRQKLTVEAWKVGVLDMPEWVQTSYMAGDLLATSGGVMVKTEKGDLRAEMGDWVLNDGANLSVMTDATFQNTYEPVE